MKTAQLAILMIVGIVLFVMVGLVLYLSKTSIQKQTGKSIQKTQETAMQSTSFKDNVQQCLDKTTKEAIRNLGRQGGYIYLSQGGQLVDFQDSDEGVLYINSGGHKVAYNIYPARISTSTFSSQIPTYPWQYFPYSSKSTTFEKFDGIFGGNSMPPLHSRDGPSAMEGGIETAIEDNIQNCIGTSQFAQQGYRILMGTPEADVTIGSKDISIRLNFPITLDSPSMQEKITVRDFSLRLDLRLNSMYIFAKDLINKDVGNIKFNIGSQDNNQDGFFVQVIKDVYNSDDIIKITDQKSNLEGKPLEYVFARKNRAPALYFLRNDELEFPQGHDITRNDILSGEQMRAEDPDEDAITFSIKINQEELTTYKLQIPEAEFEVSASDSSLIDYQTIKVTRSST